MILSLIFTAITTWLVNFYHSLFTSKKSVINSNKFSYEPIVVSQCTPEQLASWASNIDKFNASISEEDREFGVMNGESALRLITAYEQGQFPNARFVCLRIYNASSSSSDNTVGLIFLTIIDKFNCLLYLPRSITNLFHRFHIYNFILRFLTIRLSTMTFHWPFRPSIFLMHSSIEQPSTTETTLSSRCSEAYRLSLSCIGEWNNALPRSEKCSVIIMPSYPNTSCKNAMSSLSLPTVNLPPTYILPLKKLEGMSLSTYLNKIKRTKGLRVRLAPFKKAGGSAEIKTKVNDEDISFIINAASQIEEKRVKEDSTPIFFSPTKEFISALSSNPAETRSFMFMSLNKTPVASSVIFRFSPSLLTCDIAGFDYQQLESQLNESGHSNAKVYPVKMTQVLQLAIENQYQNIDFGPTTGMSKMQLGCSEVIMTGGMFCASHSMQVLSNILAGIVTRVHTRKNSKGERIIGEKNTKKGDDVEEEKEEDEEKEEEQTTNDKATMKKEKKKSKVDVDEQKSSSSVDEEKASSPQQQQPKKISKRQQLKAARAAAAAAKAAEEPSTNNDDEKVEEKVDDEKSTAVVEQKPIDVNMSIEKTDDEKTPDDDEKTNDSNKSVDATKLATPASLKTMLESEVMLKQEFQQRMSLEQTVQVA